MGRKKNAGDLERHFRMRLLQRYGIALAGRIEAVNQQVKAGTAKFIGKESNTRTHFAVNIDGKEVYVVYDRARSSVVTALPPEAMHRAGALSN